MPLTKRWPKWFWPLIIAPSSTALFLTAILLVKTDRSSQSYDNVLQIPTPSASLPLNNIDRLEKPGQILFIQGGEIISLDEGTNGKTSLFSGEDLGKTLALTPDKAILLFIDEGEIWSYSLSTGNVEQLTTMGGEIRSFNLSPDGQFLAFAKVETYVACCGQKEATRAVTMPWVMSLDDKIIKKIPWPPEYPGGTYEYSAFEKWFPDSRHILLRGMGAIDTMDNFWEYSITSNKTYLFNRYGKEYKPVTTMPAIYFSPNGMKMAYTEDDNLWIADLNGGSKRRILVKDWITNVIWSPDSQDLIIAANNLFLLKDGQSGNNLPTPLSLPDKNIAWSPNKRWIASSQFYGNDLKIYVYDFKNRELRSFPVGNIPPDEEIYLEELQFTPSGYLYYIYRLPSKKVADRYELWRISLLSGKQLKIGENTFLSLPVWLK